MGDTPRQEVDCDFVSEVTRVNSPWSIVTQGSYLVILTILGCSATMLAALSKGKSNEYDYMTSLIPFVSECLKFLVSTLFLSLQWVNNRSSSTDLIILNHSSLIYLVLAFMYANLNNLIFDVMKYMDPLSMAVLANLRVPLTAYLLHQVLLKNFTCRQMQGLSAITVGAVISRLGSLQGPASTDAKGYLLLSLLVFLSSTAGVINEKYVKDATFGCLHWQNAQLYFFSALFSGLIAWHQSTTSISLLMFENFNIYAWISVVNMACMGIVVSYSIRHCDSLLRVIAGILSMYVAAILSWLLLGVSITTWLLAGCILSTVGLIFYFDVSPLRILRLVDELQTK